MQSSTAFRNLLVVMAISSLSVSLGLTVQTKRISAASTRVGAQPITIAAAGDIACDRTTTVDASPSPKEKDDDGPGCSMDATAKILKSRPFDAVLPLGDEQYPDGTLPEFMSSYDKTWGAENSVARPVPGNHEYHTSDAAGYYKYFGTAAGDPTKGYYSWDLGGWHFIALNANCSNVGGCESGSPEERWLRSDLRAHAAACTLAYWHQPRFSSAHHHSDPTYQPFWQDLYDAGADVVLNGHDHDYERFAPQSPAGVGDAQRGIREFVVGTGGKSHYVFTATEPNSEIRNNTSFGVLEMTLAATGYEWKFVSSNGQFGDSGSGTCHGRTLAGR